MKKIIFISSLLSLMFYFHDLKSSTTDDKIIPHGILINYGFGNAVMIDEYFSQSKYSGTINNISALWSRDHSKYVVTQHIDYINSSKIKSGNLSAELTNFSLYRDYSYSLKTINIGDKKIYPYLGPTTMFNLNFAEQNFVTNGIYFNFSVNVIIGLGANAKFIFPIKENLVAESNLYINILSVIVHMPDLVVEEDEQDSPIKLTTGISAFHTNGDIGLRYYIFNPLSIKLMYKYNITNNSSWDESLKIASDIISFEIGIHF